MIHRKAEQCGVGAIKGERINPYALDDVQKYVYK